MVELEKVIRVLSRDAVMRGLQRKRGHVCHQEIQQGGRLAYIPFLEVHTSISLHETSYSSAKFTDYCCPSSISQQQVCVSQTLFGVTIFVSTLISKRHFNFDPRLR